MNTSIDVFVLRKKHLVSIFWLPRKLSLKNCHSVSHFFLGFLSLFPHFQSNFIQSSKVLKLRSSTFINHPKITLQMIFLLYHACISGLNQNLHIFKEIRPQLCTMVAPESRGWTVFCQLLCMGGEQEIQNKLEELIKTTQKCNVEISPQPWMVLKTNQVHQT